jgi:carbon monoxide dehydrogenase subunit G
MQMTGNYSFDAPPAAVWDLLMDTRAIASCIPGCQGLRPLGGDRYAADITVGVAAITATYAATVSIADKAAPNSYRLVMEASGRPGFVKGDAVVTLAPAGAGTAVNVNATAEAGGMLARIGQRMIESVGRMTMDKFFACLAGKLQAGA